MPWIYLPTMRPAGTGSPLEFLLWLAWLGLAWLGLASLDLAWLGLAWLGFVWLGLAWPCLASSGLAWLSRLGLASLGCSGILWAPLQSVTPYPFVTRISSGGWENVWVEGEKIRGLRPHKEVAQGPLLGFRLGGEETRVRNG